MVMVRPVEIFAISIIVCRQICSQQRSVMKQRLTRFTMSPLAREQHLNELYQMIRERVAAVHPSCIDRAPVYRDFRAGDVRHSLADISKSEQIARLYA